MVSKGKRWGGDLLLNIGANAQCLHTGYSSHGDCQGSKHTVAKQADERPFHQTKHAEDVMQKNGNALSHRPRIVGCRREQCARRLQPVLYISRRRSLPLVDFEILQPRTCRIAESGRQSAACTADVGMNQMCDLTSRGSQRAYRLVHKLNGLGIC